MDIRRIYVEKKPDYAIRAKELQEEIESYLGIQSLEKIRVLIRYDIENISEKTYKAAVDTIFSEPPLDRYYEESFPHREGDRIFSVEYLPGQFDQRADSAMQCIRLIDENEDAIVKTATTYVISGDIREDEFEMIREYSINPVDSRQASEEKPSSLENRIELPADISSLEGFCTMEEAAFSALYRELNLAMSYRDFEHIRRYFREEERRNPTMTEIRVLDTYWSDHCRHTTFLTELRSVGFDEGYYAKPLRESYEAYLEDRKALYGEKTNKPVSLMDLALIAMKKLKQEGRLQDLEESEEINACSIVVPVEVDGEVEEWLVNFKNETHNHPTEIEPFGGAATCLGGAIRDPLSGRTYVYQAMRVTGAADPTCPLKDTLKGKLPQRKLVLGAAAGYSSYGNQIGLATGYVKEIYHEDYAAKRLEIGAVMGAARRADVIRKSSDPGDRIILLGGRTGRDGCGGATGSSKAHQEDSMETCGAEVQKGNPPTERKIQRLFRRPEVSVLIKKCNDFGAGGVSVAIGELAGGLDIDLDRVPRKYEGLDGTEIAISESQERMAVVVDPKDADRFLAFAAEENLEATVVAEVTEEQRLRMHWRGKTIVDLSRAFLDTNGAHQEAEVMVELPEREESLFSRREVEDVRASWLNMLSDLNVCSQKGLVEMFDASIGSGTVNMPHGGKYQLSEMQLMSAKLPMIGRESDAISMMSYGFDPYLSSWSPYHGAVYAVIDSCAKIAAGGGDYQKIHFTFQEYFRRMSEDPYRWSQPFAALLGAYAAQKGLGLASIGGKDSMSGSFKDMDVPPTLVSFAVAMGSHREAVSSELKRPGNKLVLLRIERDEFDLPRYEEIREGYAGFYRAVRAGRIASAFALGRFGLAEALSKMAFGNKLGVRIEHHFDKRELFLPAWGSLVAEVKPEDVEKLGFCCTVVGEVTQEKKLEYAETRIDLEEAIEVYQQKLETVFSTKISKSSEILEDRLFVPENIYVCRHKKAVPRVFIPIMPGTNCEDDSRRAFLRAGAEVSEAVFRNLSAQDILSSIERFREEIARAQILMLPGGFSAGDEPEGSAKFFAAVLRNEAIREEIEKLLQERDGLILGICNGFQALVKTGLLPDAKVGRQNEASLTLAMNSIGRHVAKMAYTKVVSRLSPWLMKAELSKVYVNPASHGEGRFVADREVLERLFAKGQVATRYTDPEGNLLTDDEWNLNGSYFAIEGITSEDGRIFGKMLHSERRGEGVAKNIYGEQDMKIFESGVEYFR